MFISQVPPFRYSSLLDMLPLMSTLPEPYRISIGSTVIGSPLAFLRRLDSPNEGLSGTRKRTQ